MFFEGFFYLEESCHACIRSYSDVTLCLCVYVRSTKAVSQLASTFTATAVAKGDARCLRYRALNSTHDDAEVLALCSSRQSGYGPVLILLDVKSDWFGHRPCPHWQLQLRLGLSRPSIAQRVSTDLL